MNRSLSRLSRSILTVSALSLSALSLSVLSPDAQATDLRMLSSYDLTSAYTREVAQRYIDKVQGASDGEVSISLNGPDVVPPFEQLQPVSVGVFDLLYTHGAYHTNTTGVGAAIAPGSQKCSGTNADLLTAPSSSRHNATLVSSPVGGSAITSESR